MGTTQLEAAPEPKYWHLKTTLTEALDNEFEVGQILPNERDLAARYGVARATLRQALEQLELEGRLQRRRGIGTTVAPPRVGVDVSPAHDRWPGAPGDDWQIDGSERVEVPAAVARLLGRAVGCPAHLIRRTRRAHGQPVATEELYLPAAPTGAETARAALGALHRRELQGQERTVELGSARAEDARRLDRLPGSPVLLVTTRYLADDGPAAASVATYRADTCRLTFGDTGAMELLAS
ncbi:GntR family transcriptional regulator [Streptomyces alkaliterrae]|uniref:GntR family transcriptional regulator n=1 Tax=Streptomyces alkaliterrae TaxID=2213162 RepID=A0A5P0YL83_9ACTN|nr:GntR family transcriptional regulator [Streptomyces alkaliterrae]MBB1257335.1 GntR family transcriptional regulator [Streptomyces alkaliterrae]MQS01075.1 GntR family transcriptional regulator [Streptomyces alkaliterrae]